MSRSNPERICRENEIKEVAYALPLEVVSKADLSRKGMCDGFV